MKEPSPPIAAGITVLAVAEGSSAERSGIRTGDTLTSLIQAGHEQRIASPLDLIAAEREWGPRAAVILAGKRLATSLRWNLKASYWGIKPGPTWPEAKALHARMVELASTGNTAELARYCRASCEIAGNPDSRSWVLFEAATLLAESPQWEMANEFYEKAFEITRNESYTRAALIQEAWAEIYKRHRDWTKTGEHYLVALAENQKQRTESLCAAFDLYNLALVKFELGDLSEADQFGTRALHIRRKLSPNSLEVAKVLNYLGVFSFQNGDLNSAEDYIRRGLALANQVAPGSQESAFSYNNLGAIAEKRGNLGEAERDYLTDLEISSKLDGHDYLLSFSWSNLGSIALERGNLVRAKAYYLKALKVQQSKRTNKDAAMTLNNLALVSEQSGELRDAEQFLRQALETQTSVAPNSLELGQTLDTLGTIFRKQGKFTEAGEALRRGLQLREAVSPDSLDVAESLYHLGELASDRKDLEVAQQQMSAAAMIRSNLAPLSAGYAESLGGLAGIAISEREWQTAEANLAKAIDVLSRTSALIGGAGESRLHFHAKYAKYYAQYIEVLLEEGKTARAFEVLEGSRAQTLSQLLAEGHVNTTKDGHPLLTKQIQQLNFRIAKASDRRIRILTSAQASKDKDLASINGLIADLLSESERLVSQLRSTDQGFASVTGSVPLAVARLQQLLDGRTLLLEYSVLGDRVYLFSLTRVGLQVFPISSREEINSQAKLTYRLWSSLNTGTKPKSEVSAPSILSTLLLKPVADKLASYPKLVVVADGALQYIPFAGLLDPNQDSAGRSSPLMAGHEIVILPSVSLLSVLRSGPHSAVGFRKGQFAIFADPVYNEDDPRVARTGSGDRRPSLPNPKIQPDVADFVRSQTDTRQSYPDGNLNFARLLYSRTEAESIASLLPKINVFKATDFNANRATALSSVVSRSSVIHFATHGLFDSRNPEYSGLVLSLIDAKGTPQLGFLGLQDIFNLRLRANLVVLSACQTALGEEVDGEGLVGLTWGFLYAGAGNVVSSLWNVDDASTAELMRLFYKGMEDDKLSPPAALRQAQQTLFRTSRWSDPYFWAGFIVEGDPEGTPISSTKATPSSSNR